MVRPSDFTVAAIQAAVFTPHLKFQSGKALGHLLQRWSQVFSKVVFAVDMPSGTHPEVPHLVIQSEDSRHRLQASPARIDVFWMGQNAGDVGDPVAFFASASDILTSYVRSMQGRAGRLAGIISRVAPDASPANTLASMFCKPDFLESGGAFNNLSEFEIFRSKQKSRMPGVYAHEFPANDLARFRVVGVAGVDQNAAPNAIFLEQDINTLPSDLETRQFSDDSIRTFFNDVPAVANETFVSFFLPRGAE